MYSLAEKCFRFINIIKQRGELIRVPEYRFPDCYRAYFGQIRAPEAGGGPHTSFFSLAWHAFYALKRLICTLGPFVGNIKKVQDWYKSADFRTLTIWRSTTEIMGAKVPQKCPMSNCLAVFWTFLQSHAFQNILRAKIEFLGFKLNFFV